MNVEQLKEGQELQELINITQKALDKMLEMAPDERSSQRIHDDRLYYLCISEHNDGSGKKANLNRYFGNKALVHVIISELERQLNELHSKFDNL